MGMVVRFLTFSAFKIFYFLFFLQDLGNYYCLHPWLDHIAAGCRSRGYQPASSLCPPTAASRDYRSEMTSPSSVLVDHTDRKILTPSTQSLQKEHTYSEHRLCFIASAPLTYAEIQFCHLPHPSQLQNPRLCATKLPAALQFAASPPAHGTRHQLLASLGEFSLPCQEASKVKGPKSAG